MSNIVSPFCGNSFLGIVFFLHYLLRGDSRVYLRKDVMPCNTIGMRCFSKGAG